MPVWVSSQRLCACLSVSWECRFLVACFILQLIILDESTGEFYSNDLHYFCWDFAADGVSVLCLILSDQLAWDVESLWPVSSGRIDWLGRCRCFPWTMFHLPWMCWWCLWFRSLIDHWCILLRAQDSCHWVDCWIFDQLAGSPDQLFVIDGPMLIWLRLQQETDAPGLFVAKQCMPPLPFLMMDTHIF